MKSPFPGMDPYLEPYWHEIHPSLIIYARDQLQPQLPGGLRARVEQRVFVEADTGESRRVYPAVQVIEEGKLPYPVKISQQGIAVAEPLVVELTSETSTQRYIQIVDLSGKEMVTSIEFLSPSNKIPGDGQKLYLQKQAEIKAG